MRELKRQEACERLVAWEGAARELGRQEAREQLPAAVSAAADAAQTAGGTDRNNLSPDGYGSKW